MTELEEKRQAAGDWLLQKAITEIADKNPLYTYLAALHASVAGTGEAEPRRLPTPTGTLSPLPTPALAAALEETTATGAEGLGQKAAIHYIEACCQTGQHINPLLVGLHLGTSDKAVVRTFICRVQAAYKDAHPEEKHAVAPLPAVINPVPPKWLASLPERGCAVCGTRLVPRYSAGVWEAQVRFKTRKTCSLACAAQVRKGPRRKKKDGGGR